MSERSSGGNWTEPQLRSSLQQADPFCLNSKELPPVPECITSGHAKQPFSSVQPNSDPEWEIPPSALSLGTVLGEGEFGIVHKGRWNGTPVAIKVIKAASPLHRSKIALEVDVLRRVRHPNVVQFLGACTRSDPVTIVSEVLEGGSLADALQTRPQPPLRRALEIALDCARGLNCLHCACPTAIIHRDLKPDNVMLARSAGAPQGDVFSEAGVAKLADFGLSRIIGEQSIAPPAPSSNPSGIRTSGSGSLDATQPSAPGTPSSAASEGGCVDGDVDDTDDLFNPRPVDRRGPSSLQARTSSTGGGRPSTPGHSVSAGCSDGAGESFKMTGGTGSFAYMAGEIFRHEPYNAKADVYSLAMVMYEMLAGRRPFLKLDPREAARLAARDGLRPKWKSPPQCYSAADRALLPEVQALVERCWAALPAARPSCTDIIVELERLLGQLGPARPLPPSASASEGRRRGLVNINVPSPAQVVDSVHDMTAKTLSKFARGSPERSLPFTPRQRGNCRPSAVRPTQPIDVPGTNDSFTQARGKLHSPLGKGPASLPPLGLPDRGMSPLISCSQGQPRRQELPDLSPGPPIPETVLSASMPGSAGSMSERRKNFLDRFKWRVPKNRPSQQLRVGDMSSDSAMF